MTSSSLPDHRPGVALINNSQTPYRQSLHTRLVREIPQVKFYSVFTHEMSNSAWEFRASHEINPVQFGQGEESAVAGRVWSVLAEWCKGGRIIRWMQETNIRAVVLGGYNDAGRLRIIRHCRQQGIPCFLFGDSNIRGDRPTGVKGILKRLFVRIVVRACAGVMPCGELGRQYFMKYGADPNRVYLFPYEPDYAMIQLIDADALEQVRQRFGLEPGRRRVVYSGRLVAVKRVDLLIDAFVKLAEDRPDWDLIVVGDGPLRRDLQAQVPGDLAGRVKWLGFLDDQRTLSAIYRLSDALVLPSDYEPWGVVINEAVAAGMAILASDQIGAAHELVVEGQNGHIFPAGDVDGLLKGLEQVTDLSRLAEYKSGSTIALRRWEEHGDPVDGLWQALTDHRVLIELCP